MMAHHSSTAACVCGHPERDHRPMSINTGNTKSVTCWACYPDHADSDPYTGCTYFRRAKTALRLVKERG